MRAALLLAFAALPLWAAAQEPSLRPLLRQELWLSAGVEGRLPKFLKDPLGVHYKRIRLNGDVGYRSADNFFAGRQLYTDLSARYKFTDWFSLTAEYRYAIRVGGENRQRLAIQGRFGHRVGRFDLGYRPALQQNDLQRDQQSTLFRNRFSVEYRIRKWKLDPELSVEFFTRTDDPRGWFLLGTRYKLSTNWSPKEGYTIGPAVLYDRDGMVSFPVNRVIWSIDLGINLRKA